MKYKIVLLLLCVPIYFSCSQKDVDYSPPSDIKPSSGSYGQEGSSQVGIASWYGLEEHNNKAASGETFSKYAFTAAHKTLPLGTVVRVTNLENGRDVIVKINDRGPFVAGRIIDLSHAPAKSIDMIQSGTVRVKVEVVSTPSTRNGSYFDANYTVQAGSFGDRINATNVKRTLDREYDQVRVESIKVGGSQFYRVRVGRYSTKDQANKVAKQLKKKGYKGKVVLE